MNEKLPDVMELSLGQLQSQSSAEITVKMVCELEVIKHGFFSLIFPLEFFPRYGDTEGIFGQEGTHLPAEFSLDFVIKSPSVITNLAVSHEKIIFEQSEDGTEVRLKMDPSKSVPAKDLVVSYSTKQIREPKFTLTRCGKYPGEVAVHISFIPRSSAEHPVEERKIDEGTLTELDDQDDPEVASGEFIFIIDRSGSMTGSFIKQAKEALSLFIRSIPRNSKFNVISFGSSHNQMYPESVTYDSQTMNEALAQITKFQADMGGTELYSPINIAVSKPHDHK
mmetsp:Transcript_31263/g.35704  ORF Transcript_31263/g.35704 Transcript_31263/m.35704 type:complete len:280 (+) Transcript_31263:449-1288(+)